MPRTFGRVSIVVAGCILFAACGADSATTESDSVAPSVAPDSQTVPESATTTTFPFPSSGTVPSSDISRLQTGDDLVKAAEIARTAWIPTHDPSCYESDTELNAALDEFGRLPLYMGNLMTRAKDLGAIDAYVTVNDVRKEVARWNPSRSVSLCAATTTTSTSTAPDPATETSTPESSTTTTTVPRPRSNVDTNGSRPVPLATTGPFAVNTALTVSDDSAACDGRSPSTRFWLMRYDESLLEWLVEDFTRPKDAATSAQLTPSQPGEHRVEYFAYCGTQDVRSGAADVQVPGLDITAGPTATTAVGASTTPIYAIVSNASPSVTLRGDATHVIVEPQAAIEWLDGSPAGTVTLRAAGGQWAVLSTRFATIVPVGNDTVGLEVDVVGTDEARTITVKVVDTTTTTLETTTTTIASESDRSADAPANTAVIEESTGEGGDATLWVILGLVGLAAAAVFLARLRLL